MEYQTNSYTVPEIVIVYPVLSSSATTRRRWWNRPIVTCPAFKPTFKEFSATATPCCGGLFTIVALYCFFLLFLDKSLPHAEFSIHSFTVSPSSNTWHVDFLVKNPNSRYSIYYEGDDASAKLGPLNVAIVNMSHIRESRDVTALSLDFVAENDVVYDELNVKLRGMHKQYVDDNRAGHFDVRCRNLTRSHENKILCESSFTLLHTFD